MERQALQTEQPTDDGRKERRERPQSSRPDAMTLPSLRSTIAFARHARHARHAVGAAVAGAVALTTLTFAPSRAHAGPKLGVEADFALPVSTPGASAGAGGAARFGYDLGLGVVHVMPEVGAGFHKFSGAANPSVFRGFVGARAGFGVLLRLDGFAHLGYGSIAAAGGSAGSPLLDLGLAVDFTLIPRLELGFHTSYNTTLGDATKLKWLGLGVHLTLAF